MRRKPKLRNLTSLPAYIAASVLLLGFIVLAGATAAGQGDAVQIGPQNVVAMQDGSLRILTLAQIL